MSEVDEHTMDFLRQAVNALAVQLGDITHSWQLHKATRTKWEDIYRVEIILDGGVLHMQGIALVFAPYVVDIMLNGRTIYTLLQSYIDGQLEKYTREHPWIVGV